MIRIRYDFETSIISGFLTIQPHRNVMLTTKLLFSFVYLCYAVNEILAIICGQPTRTANSFSSEGRTNIFYVRLTNSRKFIAT